MQVVDRDTNRFVVEKALKEEGLPRLAIAGLLGRIEAESGFDPDAVNPSDPNGGSFGLFQWQGARRKQLETFLADNNLPRNDPIGQARFLAAEVKGEIGTERNNGKRLLDAVNPQEAAKAAMGLARPQGFTRANPEKGLGFKKTLDFAKNYIRQTSDPGSRDESPFAKGAGITLSGREDSGAQATNDVQTGEPGSGTPIDGFLLGVLEGLSNIDFAETQAGAGQLPAARPDTSLLNNTRKSVSQFLQTLPGTGLRSIR